MERDAHSAQSDHQRRVLSEQVQRYLEKHAERVFPLVSGSCTPKESLRLAVVIPALAERENIGAVVDSLSRSERLDSMELIVVVNNSRDAPPEHLDNNQQTIQELKTPATDAFPVLVVDRSSLPLAFAPEMAGVGAARRVGMDLALRRLMDAGRPERSAIACLDADSPVAPGYVDNCLRVFDRSKPPLGGICEFEHPIPSDPEKALAIVIYECWLRYVEFGFRLGGSPYAIQTIGSCMVASCLGYALADGMPRRKAGEDFYFLQKIIKAGGPNGVVRIPHAKVYPSPRISARVPFGTGRAMLRCEQEGCESYLHAEPAQAFFELRRLFSLIPEGFSDPKKIEDNIHPSLCEFIQRQKGWETLNRLRKNASGPQQFLSAVHRWFDSLQVVRYARFRKLQIGGQWLFEAIYEVLTHLELGSILDGLKIPPPGIGDLRLPLQWLERLRTVNPQRDPDDG